MRKRSRKNIEKEIIAESLLAWIKKEKIKNEKGEPIEFDRHYFLLDLFVDRSKEIVVRKGAQVGVSTFAILREMHDAKYWGINQIHTLPSDKDVWKFVPTKVDKIIKINNLLLDKDSTEIKGMGKAFVYYLGTFSEKAPIMVSSDRNVYDEVDKSKQEIIRDFSSRLSFSALQEKIYLSTPTIPDFGIDALFNHSDQKHWRFICPHCHYCQHLEWEKNVDFGSQVYICQKCHQKISIEDVKQGGWEARFPDREVSGYWISQMLARPAKELIKELEDAEDEQYFYNFILGLPYLNPEAQISAGLILKNLTSIKNEEKNCVMGVDVQLRELYIILGNEKGVFGIARIDDNPEKSMWDRLAELMEVYEVRYAVIDAEYKTNDVLAFAKRFPHKVYMAWYREDPKKIAIVRFGDEGKFTDKRKDFEEEIKVLVDRNRIIDALIDDLKKGKIPFNFTSGDARVAELVNHAKRIYSRVVTDRVGVEHREWASLGQDDLFHALILFKVALDKKLRYEVQK